MSSSAPAERSDSGRLIVVMLVALTALYGGYAFVFGPVVSPDTGRYESWARHLIEVDFDFSRFLGSSTFSVPPIFYLGYVTVVAVLRVVAGRHAHTIHLVMNVAAFALAAFCTMSLVNRVTHSRAATLAAGAGFALVFELSMWVRYVLSDPLFLCFCAAALWAIGCAVVDGGSRRWLAAVPLVLLATAARPTGVVVAGFAFIALTVRWILPDADRAPRRIRFFFAAAALLWALGSIAFAALIANRHWLDGTPITTALAFYGGYFDKGAIIDDRPETWIAPGGGITTFVAIAQLRLLYFFAFLTKAFSTVHKVINIVVFPPLYGLAGFGAYAMFQPGWLSLAERRTALLATIFVLMFAGFHALTLIDYDWRYRVPVYPALFVLSGIAVAYIERRRADAKAA